MRVVVPATPTGLRPEVMPAIAASGYDADLRICGPGEEYYWLVRDLWRDGKTFAIVEQDIVVDPAAGTLFSFDACPEEWCAFSYEVFAGDVATAYGFAGSLGCTRFRRELLERHPRAVIAAGELDLHPKHPPRSYAVMDSTLAQVLRGLGAAPHQHFPNVEHLHHYDREHAYVPPAAPDAPIPGAVASPRA